MTVHRAPAHPLMTHRCFGALGLASPATICRGPGGAAASPPAPHFPARPHSASAPPNKAVRPSCRTSSRCRTRRQRTRVFSAEPYSGVGLPGPEVTLNREPSHANTFTMSTLESAPDGSGRDFVRPGRRRELNRLRLPARRGGSGGRDRGRCGDHVRLRCCDCDP
jgi:hypothetical protein